MTDTKTKPERRNVDLIYPRCVAIAPGWGVCPDCHIPAPVQHLCTAKQVIEREPKEEEKE